MRENEIAKIEDHICDLSEDWTTIVIFNKLTKEKISEYGPFKYGDEYKEAKQFAREHGIVLTEETGLI